MSKLREDLSIAVLGAAAGLFSFGITLLIVRIDTYYAYLSSIRESTYYYERGVEDLWWVPLSVWHIILSVVASLLIHRYLTTSLRSPFLLWQIVGITTLYGWLLSVVVAMSIGCVMSGSLSSLEHIPSTRDAWLVGKFVATVFACNVFYGAVMSASSRQYVEKIDAEVAG